jgi:hypothetical protein
VTGLSRSPVAGGGGGGNGLVVVGTDDVLWAIRQAGMGGCCEAQRGSGERAPGAELGGGGAGRASAGLGKGRGGGAWVSALSREAACRRVSNLGGSGAAVPRDSYGRSGRVVDLKRERGSMPWRAPPACSALRVLEPQCCPPACDSPPAGAASRLDLRSGRASALTDSCTRATPMAALKRAEMRSCSPGAVATASGCRSGGYHLPSDASHHRLVRLSSPKAVPIRPETSEPRAAGETPQRQASPEAYMAEPRAETPIYWW